MEKLVTGESDTDHFLGLDGIEGIKNIRKDFDSGTQFGAALGGWDESPWFNVTLQEGTRTKFINHIMEFVEEFNLDFIDIDWEYPGGGGVNYKSDTDKSKSEEIESFPKFLKQLREELRGKNKGLSIAVAGKPSDIEVYKSKANEIWNSVDFVNIMTYDLMNRRDKVTAHASSVKDTNATITEYLKLGLPAKKINLGMPLYAKFAKLADESCEGPLGCQLAAAENEDGTDAHTMDTVTFESQNFQSTKVTEITTNGTCGSNNLGCPKDECCSRYGTCGEGDDYCGYMCQYAFGDCSTAHLNMMASFRRAMANGTTDNEQGAMWFIDRYTAEGNVKYNHFWSWDSPDSMREKIEKIVIPRKLGGSMAWALGHDSHDWEHIKAIRDALDKGDKETTGTAATDKETTGITETGTVVTGATGGGTVEAATAAESPNAGATLAPEQGGGAGCTKSE